MQKIARILLDVCAIGWITFVIVAIIMVLSSCSFESKASEDIGMHSIQCENCDEVD